MNKAIKKNVFVFVVCGDDKHIQTLNFSLQYLKHFSSNEIIVITDNSRNSSPIRHENIIHVSTPKQYNNHQASIFLKTSIHRYVNPSNNYCYLDSDVIAINKNVDEVFNNYVTPITFANDHCRINEFSPYAVKCQCKIETEKNVALLEKLIQKYNPYFLKEKENYNHLSRELRRIVTKAKKNPLRNFFFLFRYFFGIFISPKEVFKFTDEIYFNRKNKTWCDTKGDVFLYHALNYYKQIQNESDFKFKLPQFEWVTKNGNNIYNCKCNHLSEKIYSKFGVNITDQKWQHWNGGVFLFDNNSFDFLETWHKHTLEIFEDPEWETRDQGTLALTVWEKKLQNHPVLQSEFNFLADFNNPMITYNNQKGYTTNNFETTINPSFIHVYHNFGLKGWEIWDAIENVLINKKIYFEN